MKILLNAQSNSIPQHRLGWHRAMNTLGVDSLFWLTDTKPVIDVLDEEKPDVLICTHNEISPELLLYAKNSPLKVMVEAGLWGDIDSSLALEDRWILANDEVKSKVKTLVDNGVDTSIITLVHPKKVDTCANGWRSVGAKVVGLPLAADTHEYSNGKEVKSYKADMNYVGTLYPQKMKAIKEYLFPLCSVNTQHNLKIYGSNLWPVANFVGYIPPNRVKDVLKSATICPNIVNSTMERSGAYINERIFQIGAAGGFALSMYVESGSNDLFDSGVFWIKSSTDFFNVCRYFIAHPDERIPFMEALQKEVLEKHTYVHRIRSLLEFLDVKTI